MDEYTARPDGQILVSSYIKKIHPCPATSYPPVMGHRVAAANHSGPGVKSGHHWHHEVGSANTLLLDFSR